MCLAVPGKIMDSWVDVDSGQSMGRVAFGEIQKQVNLCFVPEAQVGDYVIVHVGFAISRLDEEEAKQTLEYLAQISELNELREP